MMRKLSIILSIISIFLVSSVIVRAAFPAQVSVNITSSFDRTNKNMTHSTVSVDWNNNLTLDGATIHPSYAFQFWILNGTVNEELPASLNMKVKTSMNLHAVFSKAGEHAVLFVDSNGKLISLQYVSDAQTVTAPSYDGYTKPGQTVNESTPWKTLSGNSSLENITSSRVYVLQYETNVQLVTITLVNATVSSIEKNINKVVTVTANDLVDFEYWKNADNEVVSYSPSFSFTATKNITLTAEMLDDSKTPANLVTISQDLEIRTGYNTYVGRFELLEGQTIHEFGFLVSKTSPYVDFNSEDTQIVKSNAYNEMTNEFIMSFSIGSYIIVKSYIIVDNAGTLSSYVSSPERTTETGEMPTDLIISEYVKGSSNDKAIELYNGTNSTIDLSGYKLVQYNNGATSYGNYSLDLTGSSVASKSTFIIVNNSASPTLKAYADLLSTSNVMGFNGDDAIALLRNEQVIDVFGKIGQDPGTGWGTPVITADNTLIRKSSTILGDTDGNDDFDPLIEWTVLGSNNFSNLGTHSMDSGVLLSSSEKATLDLNAVSFSSTKKNSISIPLTSIGSYGSSLSYYSDSPDTIIVNGSSLEFMLPSEQPVTVIITVKVVNGASVLFKDFEILVGLTDQEKVDADAAALTVASSYTANTTITLSTTGGNGSLIAWASSNEDLINPNNGTVTMPASGQEIVTLAATLSLNGKQSVVNFEVTLTASVQPETLVYSENFESLSSNIAYNTSPLTFGAITWIAKEVTYYAGDTNETASKMLRFRGANTAYLYTQNPLTKVTRITFDAKYYSSSHTASVMKVSYQIFGTSTWVELATITLGPTLESKEVIVNQQNVLIRFDVTVKSANIDNIKIYGNP